MTNRTGSPASRSRRTARRGSGDRLVSEPDHPVEVEGVGHRRSLPDSGCGPIRTLPRLRYDLDRSDLAQVLAPPYDVIDAAERAALAGRDPHNAVRIDLPDEAERRPAATSGSAGSWPSGWPTARWSPTPPDLHRVPDDLHSTTPGRAAHHRRDRRPRAEPAGQILPHEHTTPKAKTDRLDLLRASRANLSAIWGLSLAKGLTDLLDAMPRPSPTSSTRTACATPSGGSTTPTPARPSRRPSPSTRSSSPTATTATRPRSPTSRSGRDADGDPGAAGATLAYLVRAGRGRADACTPSTACSTGSRTGSTWSPRLEPWFEPVGAPPAWSAGDAAPWRRRRPRLVLPDRERAPATAARRPRRGARPRLEPPRRRPGGAPRPRPVVPARGRQRPRRGRVRSRPRPASCSGRRRSPRSRPPPTAASACRPRRRSSTPSPGPASSSAPWTDLSGAPPVGRRRPTARDLGPVDIAGEASDIQPRSPWCGDGRNRASCRARRAPEDRQEVERPPGVPPARPRREPSPLNSAKRRRPRGRGADPAGRPRPRRRSSADRLIPSARRRRRRPATTDRQSTSQVEPLRRRRRGRRGPWATASASWRSTSVPYSGRSTARNTPIGVGS